MSGNRIHPLNSWSVNSGRIQSPGTGQTQGPRGPQGPSPTHPKTLERIGPLAGLMGRGMRPAKEADTRRAELPRSSRDIGTGRSFLSSMKHAASKTGQAISYGFNRAGQVVHRFGQSSGHSEPAWMRNMNAEERAHYDYYGELPAESSHSSHSSSIAAPWEQSEPSYPSSPSVSPRPSPSRTGQATENQQAQAHHAMARPTVEQPQQPPASRPTGDGREALKANIREAIPRTDLNRLHHGEPHQFVRFAIHLSRGTRYEAGVKQLAANDPSLGAAMKNRWLALQNHLQGLRAQGHQNVPSAEWLFMNRSVRMMSFLVDGSGGDKLVQPATPHGSAAKPSSTASAPQAHPGRSRPDRRRPCGAPPPPPPGGCSPPQTPRHRALRGQVLAHVEAYATNRRRTPETRERPVAAMQALDKLSDRLSSPAQYGEFLTELQTLLRTSNSARRNSGLKAFTDKVTRFTANIDKAQTQPQPQAPMHAQASPPPQHSAATQAPEPSTLDVDHFMQQEEQRADYYHERPDYAAARDDYQNYLQAQQEPASPEPAMAPPQPERADSGFNTASTAQTHERPLDAFYQDAEEAARYHGVQPDYAGARTSYETQGYSAPQPAEPEPLPGQAGKAVQEYRSWMSSPGFAQRFGSAGKNLMSNALGALEQHGAKLPPGQLDGFVRDLGRIVGESVNNPVKLGQLKELVAEIREAARPPQAQPEPSPDDLRRQQDEARYYGYKAS